jgi:hypothetical protein
VTDIDSRAWVGDTSSTNSQTWRDRLFSSRRQRGWATSKKIIAALMLMAFVAASCGYFIHRLPSAFPNHYVDTLPSTFRVIVATFYFILFATLCLLLLAKNVRIPDHKVSLVLVASVLLLACALAISFWISNEFTSSATDDQEAKVAVESSSRCGRRRFRNVQCWQDFRFLSNQGKAFTATGIGRRGTLACAVIRERRGGGFIWIEKMSFNDLRPALRFEGADRNALIKSCFA